jgi:stress-induced morphogen
MIDLIKDKLHSAIPDSTIHLFDLHEGGDHFQAIVISPSFNTMSLIKQHQLVLNALKNDFKDKVHALQLKTFTPEKWESEKENFPMIAD